MSKFPIIHASTCNVEVPWASCLSLAQCVREVSEAAWELSRPHCPGAYWLGATQVDLGIQVAQQMLSLYGEADLPPVIERAMVKLEAALAAPAGEHAEGSCGLCTRPEDIVWAII